VAQGQIR